MGLGHSNMSNGTLNSRVLQGGTRWSESYGYKLSLLDADLEVVVVLDAGVAA